MVTDEFTITSLQEAILCHCIQPPKTLSRETTLHSYLSRIILLCLATGPYLYI